MSLGGAGVHDINETCKQRQEWSISWNMPPSSIKGEDHTLRRFIRILRLSLELTYRVITAEFDRSSSISPSNWKWERNTINKYICINLIRNSLTQETSIITAQTVKAIMKTSIENIHFNDKACWLIMNNNCNQLSKQYNKVPY